MPIETTSRDLSFSGSNINKETGKMHGVLEWSIKAGKKIIIFTEALVLISLFSKFTIIRDVNAVNERLEGLKYAVAEKSDLEEEYNAIAMDIEKIKAVENSRVNWDARIIKITSIVPTDMTLKSTIYSSDTIEVSGDVKSVQGFAFFIQELLTDDNITRIALKTSKYDKNFGGYLFTMDIGIR